MDYLGKDGDETPSLNAIWTVCEDVEDMLAACADVCGRVSTSQDFLASTSRRTLGHGPAA